MTALTSACRPPPKLVSSRTSALSSDVSQLTLNGFFQLLIVPVKPIERPLPGPRDAALDHGLERLAADRHLGLCAERRGEAIERKSVVGPEALTHWGRMDSFAPAGSVAASEIFVRSSVPTSATSPSRPGTLSGRTAHAERVERQPAVEVEPGRSEVSGSVLHVAEELALLRRQSAAASSVSEVAVRLSAGSWRPRRRSPPLVGRQQRGHADVGEPQAEQRLAAAQRRTAPGLELLDRGVGADAEDRRARREARSGRARHRRRRERRGRRAEQLAAEGGELRAR